MNFIYKVELGYRTYTFASGTTALTFAEIAKAHQDEEQEVTITVEVKKDE